MQVLACIITDYLPIVKHGKKLAIMGGYGLVSVVVGLVDLANEIKQMRQSWKGNFAYLEVSNLTGENLDELLYSLSGSVISSPQMMP